MAQLLQIDVGGIPVFATGPDMTMASQRMRNVELNTRGLGAMDEHTYRVVGGIALFVGAAAIAGAIITIGRL